MSKKKTFFKVIGIFLIVAIAMFIILVLIDVLNRDEVPLTDENPNGVPPLEEMIDVVNEGSQDFNNSEETYVPPLVEENLSTSTEEGTYVPPLEELDL